MKRMITRLIMAQFIPVGIKLVKKAVRKKKISAASQLDGGPDQHSLDAPDHRPDQRPSQRID